MSRVPKSIPSVCNLYIPQGVSSVCGISSIHSAPTVYGLERVCSVCVADSVSHDLTLPLQWLMRPQQESTTERAHTSFKAGRRIRPPCGHNCVCRASAPSNLPNVSGASGLSRMASVSRVSTVHRECWEFVQCLARIKPNCGRCSVSRVSWLSGVSEISRVSGVSTVSRLSSVSGVSAVSGVSLCGPSGRIASPPPPHTFKRPQHAQEDGRRARLQPRCGPS